MASLALSLHKTTQVEFQAQGIYPHEWRISGHGVKDAANEVDRKNSMHCLGSGRRLRCDGVEAESDSMHARASAPAAGAPRYDSDTCVHIMRTPELQAMLGVAFRAKRASGNIVNSRRSFCT